MRDLRGYTFALVLIASASFLFVTGFSRQSSPKYEYKFVHEQFSNRGDRIAEALKRAEAAGQSPGEETTKADELYAKVLEEKSNRMSFLNAGWEIVDVLTLRPAKSDDFYKEFIFVLRRER